MIKLRNIIELFTIVWKSKQKKYLVLATTTNLEIARITEFKDFNSANKHALELIRMGDVRCARVVMELSYLEVKKEIKK